MMKRCEWVPDHDQIYVNYHDQQWGVPVTNEHEICEMFFLETFQAGLSWITILKKKEAFREAFDDFDPVKIACYTEDKIQELLLNPGIIRCQRKIRAAVTNAGIILKIRAEKGSFSEYLWSFSNHQRIVNTDNHFKTTSDLSDRISKDLKKRGMSYVGSITIYSYLQAIGIVNDHHTECFRYAEIEQGAQQ